MTEVETGIMRDAFRFLKTFGDPPVTDSDEYWRRAADALTAAGEKWKHHPLAGTMFVGLYEYLETKQKEMSA